MNEEKSNKWVRDNKMNHWSTPGGDPVWICPYCGLGRHVYGIEHPRTLDRCPDCGRKLDGYEY